MKKLYPLLFLVLTTLSLSSCSGKIGLGFSKNTGNIFLEDDEGKKKGNGGYIGYEYQKMYDKHGFGLGANLSYRGYKSDCQCHEGTDTALHFFKANYYYTAMRNEAKSVRLDLVLGLGIGKYTINSLEGYSQLSWNTGMDFYFTSNDFFYLSQRINYVNQFSSNKYNLGIEFGIGCYFKRKK